MFDHINRVSPLRTLFVYSLLCIVACNTAKPGKEEKIIDNVKKIDAAVSVQLENILNTAKDTGNSATIKNPFSVTAFYKSNEFNPVWSSQGSFSAKADTLVKFINKNCKYYGLFPASYQHTKIEVLYKTLSNVAGTSKNNAEEWAKMDVLLTDAFFQIAKHVKNGRLYNDTNFRHFDTTLHQQVFVPAIKNFLDKSSLDQELGKLEPRFSDYDSLKIALKNLLNASGKKYTYVKFPYNDSIRFIRTLTTRIQEDGIGTDLGSIPDSIELNIAIKEWQRRFGLNASGMYSGELVDAMNGYGISRMANAALSMDKLKRIKLAHNGDYILVNIPSYYLRAYSNNRMQVESKVAVGKSASKTPEMESEISDLVLMPNWYVPPSILKIPGYIERHRGRKNFIVKGKTVIQKSGPGNALGEMKFNFKSGDAIYLHDTNEKWAFGASRRAVSHGCVRVQQYKFLGDFIGRVSPIYEKEYERVFDKLVIDTAKHDTIAKYKYLVKDSTLFKGDSVITRLLKNKVHRELTVQRKLPIYIKYFTCAARNGSLVLYPDVYGYDKVLLEKYFSGLSE
jgi:L,D-transpeptidase YcbB